MYTPEGRLWRASAWRLPLTFSCRINSPKVLSADLSQRAQRAALREKIAAMKVLAEREWLAGLVAG
ncbi:MAG TPA: hypothetical protein VK168_03455 [Saprospiraceae bacterium]|nr:hypothetical protein [Saprospiraceae bacterium]